MATQRREFIKTAGMGLVAAGLGGTGSARAETIDLPDGQLQCANLAWQGPKEILGDPSTRPRRAGQAGGNLTGIER